jgi:flagellar protein FlbD
VVRRFGTEEGKVMIQLTRLNGQPLVLNSDLIKLIENAPDTVITLVNDEKIVVKEPGETILGLIVDFRRRVLNGPQMNLSGRTPKEEDGGEIQLKAPPSEEA